MDHIRTLLPKVLKRRGLLPQAEASLVVYQAQQWLQRELPAFAEALRAESCKEGTLLIACANAIAAQECHQVADRLLQYLKEQNDLSTLRDIRLLRGRGQS